MTNSTKRKQIINGISWSMIEGVDKLIKWVD